MAMARCISLNVTDFRTLCHAAARSIRGTVPELTLTDVTPNFHAAPIIAPGMRSSALRHAVLPFVAFAVRAPQAGVSLTTFTSPPAWADAFERGGFQLLGVDELSAPWATAGFGKPTMAAHVPSRGPLAARARGKPTALHVSEHRQHMDRTATPMPCPDSGRILDPSRA
ncbi:hypothetical protein ACWCXS_22380 [Streptomyces sp. NPDC001685]